MPLGTTSRSMPVLAAEAARYQAASAYAEAARAPATRRAYRSDWADFSAWCAAVGASPLPAEPEVLALYLVHCADERGLKTATIGRRLQSIAQAHKAANLATPTTASQVRLVWAGIRRKLGTAQRGKAPLLVDQLKRAVRRCSSSTLIGLRDRALLLVGFAGAFRRSELVALDVEDLAYAPRGVTLTIRRSKTDQEGHGRQLGILYGRSTATCPVRALQALCSAADIRGGPIFRTARRGDHLTPHRLSAQSVALILKRRLKGTGLDLERYAGHSLRAGLATSAAEADIDERTIMAQTGHRSTEMVRRYIRSADLLNPTKNVTGRLGL